MDSVLGQQAVGWGREPRAAVRAVTAKSDDTSEVVAVPTFDEVYRDHRARLAAERLTRGVEGDVERREVGAVLDDRLHVRSSALARRQQPTHAVAVLTRVPGLGVDAPAAAEPDHEALAGHERADPAARGLGDGVLEARGLFRSDEEFLRDVDAVCADSDDVRFRRTCAHGVGHAMFWRTGADLDQTWSLCDRIRDERSDDLEVLFNRFVLSDTRYSSRAECKSASVMEWADRWGFERINGVPTVLSPVLDEPMDVCLRYESEEMFQVGCYLGTNYRSDDPVKAALRCEEDAPYPVSCFATLGDNLGRFALNNLDGIDDAGYLRLALSVGDACMLAGDDDAAFACARHLAFRYFVSVQKEQVASRLCDRLAGRLQAGCRSGLQFGAEVLAAKR